MGVQEGGREMKSEERRAATREMRRRLEDIGKQVEGQRAQLAEAHAQLDPRARLNITPEVRERFELLCTVPVRPARAVHGAPQSWSLVRC
jgi:hypothetical protein